MEPSAPEPTRETAQPSERGGIDIGACTVRSLADAERLVAAIQNASRKTFGVRQGAMGAPSMGLGDFLRSFDGINAGRVSITMAGTVEVYGGEDGNWDELIGFVEVREGGGYVAVD